MIKTPIHLLSTEHPCSYLLMAERCCKNACGGTNTELAGRGVHSWGGNGCCTGGTGAWFGTANSWGYMLLLDTGTLLCDGPDAVANSPVPASTPAPADGFGVVLPTQQKENYI